GSVVSGATSDGGNGDFGGVPLDGGDSTTGDSTDTSGSDDTSAPDAVSSPVLCGPGAAAFAPLTMLSLGLIRVGRRRAR
ncbi:MAG: hypothetical protein D6744_04175, partial [Planctomycetota bacterium]